MLRLLKCREIWQNLGFSPFSFVREQFQEIGIVALSLGLKPSHVEKFRQ